MAWLSAFKLGRPGYELLFDVNPEEMDTQWARVSSDNYNLTGDLKERVLRTMRPTVKLRSSWFPKTQLDKFVSLLTVTDTFLSFIPRDDWQVQLEYDLAPNTTTVQIQNSSITKLSTAYAAGGFGSTITVNGVFTAPDGSGENYYTGGSYADATRTITFGTPIPAAGAVYVTYTYTGWLCRLKQLDTPITGGRVDLFSYDFQLDGV